MLGVDVSLATKALQGNPYSNYHPLHLISRQIRVRSQIEQSKRLIDMLDVTDPKKTPFVKSWSDYCDMKESRIKEMYNLINLEDEHLLIKSAQYRSLFKID